MLLQELREQVAEYGRRLLAEGLTTFCGGNISVRDAATGLIAIKPTSVPYDRLTAEMIPVIDPDGTPVEGTLRPSSEWPMHTLIYKTYPRAGAVVHCHSPMASAMAAAGRELPLICHEICIYCTAPVRVTPFAVPGTPELGQRALEGFGTDNEIALLRSHGTVTMGADLWHAFDAACAAELTARIALAAASLGGAAEVPPDGRAALRRLDPMTRPAAPERRML